MVSNKISGGLKLFDGTNLTLIYCNGSRHIDVCFALTSPNIDISSPSTYTSRYKNDINKHNDSTVQTDAYQSKGNPTVNPQWALPLTQHQALNFSSTEQNETSWFTLYHIFNEHYQLVSKFISTLTITWYIQIIQYTILIHRPVVLLYDSGFPIPQGNTSCFNTVESSLCNTSTE